MSGANDTIDLMLLLWCIQGILTKAFFMKLLIEPVLISLLLTDDAIGQVIENPIQVSGFHSYIISYPKIDQRACRLLPEDLGFPLSGRTITYPIRYINGSIIGRLLRRIPRHFSKEHCLVS